MSVELSFAIARVVIGLVFAGHGLQKLAGWFGGPGLRGFAGMLQSSGLRHASAFALLVALVETGGLLFAAGFLTPLIAAALAADMLVAIYLVHWKNGFWITKGGYEYALVLAVVTALIGLTGGTTYAVDRWLPAPITDWAPALFVIALVVGLIVFAAESVLSRGSPAQQTRQAA
jgi:putative oxidoreductase